jgi:CRISPR-associated protein Csx14
VGFSPNEQGIEVESSPAIELLAAIGVQRFRPVMSMDRSEFKYCAWSVPVCVVVAAANAAGACEVGRSKRFLGTVVQRGQYGALGQAREIS